MRPSERMDEAATIVAVATPPGEGALGIVRLSGPEALHIAEGIFKAKNRKKVSDQRSFTARLGHILEKDAPERVIDEAILLVMRAPNSFTGEDVAEFSVHGGPAVLQGIVRRALEEGARPAQPGEFTKRAFLNGKIDLLQAEAVLDLIHAKTDRLRQWASAQLEGHLSKKMHSWKDELVGILSHLEAAVDFPDDLPDTQSLPELEKRLRVLVSGAERMLSESKVSFLAKRGLRVVLCGRPNSGKSSLVNCFARSDRMIVTPYPGTTRDTVEVECSLGGFPVRFVDTAGIREAEHPVEKEGVDRSRKAIQDADLILYVIDAHQKIHVDDEQLLKEWASRPGCVVLNKSDLSVAVTPKDIQPLTDWPIIATSAVTDRGVETLEAAVVGRIGSGLSETSSEALISTARQKSLLEKVLKDMRSAADGCHQKLSPELISSDVKEALDCLGEMVGEVIHEDILEVLFKNFCIGK